MSHWGKEKMMWMCPQELLNTAGRWWTVDLRRGHKEQTGVGRNRMGARVLAGRGDEAWELSGLEGRGEVTQNLPLQLLQQLEVLPSWPRSSDTHQQVLILKDRASSRACWIFPQELSKEPGETASCLNLEMQSEICSGMQIRMLSA